MLLEKTTFLMELAIPNYQAIREALSTVGVNLPKDAKDVTRLGVEWIAGHDPYVVVHMHPEGRIFEDGGNRGD